MDKFKEFSDSLKTNIPPKNISSYLLALWYDAKENWEAAHQTVQEIDSVKAAWIHAYLHRKEGDIANSRYWYALAKKKIPNNLDLKQEWEEIVREML